jgi:hypothetical protein
MTNLTMANDITDALTRLYSLSECIIEDIVWRDFGLTIDVVIDYIYDDKGKVRTDSGPRRLLTLQFHLVQEIHFIAALNTVMLTEPDRVNWGINEISRVELVANSKLLPRYDSAPVDFHHLAFHWEGEERSLDVVFAELRLLEDVSDGTVR